MSVVVALLVCSAWLAGFAAYLGWHETIDDAAITFTYSQNLVRGEGLVLTPGADAVEGYTTFLWMLAMTPVEALGFDSIGFAKVLGVTLAVGTLACLAWIPAVAFRRPASLLDLLAPALTAAALPFALWSVSGMENAMQSFFLVVAVYLTMREVNEPSATPWSAAAFLCVALTRPEGIAYFAAAVAHRLLLMAMGRRSRMDLVWLAVFVVPFALYHIGHFIYFGELVPNTYFAKASDRSFTQLFEYLTSPEDPGFGAVRGFFTEYWPLPTFSLWGFSPESIYGLQWHALVILAPLLGFCVLGRRGLTHWSLPLGIVIIGISAVVYGGGDWMPYHRFISPLLPLIYLCVQESVRAFIWEGARLVAAVRQRAHFVKHNDASQSTGRAGPSVLVLGGLMAVIGLTLLVSTLSESVDRAGQVRDRPFWAEYSIVKERAEEMQALAVCLNRPRATILTPDIGAFAYNTELQVIDIVGLADAYVARNREGPAFLNYVFEERRPDIIATHAPWFKGIDLDARLAEQYVTYSTQYVDAWRADFIVYVRKDVLEGRPECV